MAEVAKTKTFDFPYTGLHFPGMNTGEKILFITRESAVMLKLRLMFLCAIALLLLILGYGLIKTLDTIFALGAVLYLPLLILGGLIITIGWFWISQTYWKSLFIITTRRLTKIIWTSPFTWYQFSLGLDEIEDTGSYSASYFEAIFGLGYFVARSGAAAIKNFKIVNITFAQDLHNYVNKLLYAFKHHPGRMDEFRPFVPHLKGDARRELLANYPEYKTEF